MAGADGLGADGLGADRLGEAGLGAAGLGAAGLGAAGLGAAGLADEGKAPLSRAGRTIRGRFIRHRDGEATSDGAEQFNIPWLLRLRYGAAIGHVVTIFTAHFAVGLSLPLGPMLAIVGLALATNVTLDQMFRRGARLPSWTAGVVMVGDVLLLTVMLWLAGGASNPAVAFYFVHISLATLVSGRRWQGAIVGFSLVCLVTLFLMGPDAEPWRGVPQPGAAYLWGKVAFMVIAAGFIFYFGDRVGRALRERDEEIAMTRDATARDEKLASLATLAAGAAHELSTPLSTIAMLSGELRNNLRDGRIGFEEAAEDARVIREEVRRCRDVLNLMSAEAGESRGEAFEERTVRALLDEALRHVDTSRLKVDLTDPQVVVHVPPRPMALALRGIIKNACQASPSDRRVEIHAVWDGHRVNVAVRDHGPGMAPDVAHRATEPFFTTKPAGEGMGLGLFLALDLARRAGGDLMINSAPGRGTQVTLSLPRVTPSRPPAAIARLA
ncbi:MAG: ATP-binding protein [Myxococcota bacterium]